MAALVLIGLVVPPSNALAGTPPTTLYAGQQLVNAGSGGSLGNSIQSAGGEFRFGVAGDYVGIIETAPIGPANSGDSEGVETWYRDDPHGDTPTDRSTLRMQTDGNLVLRTAAGRVLWASNTVGTGADNYLTMQTDGNLVMYTSARKAVWASRTTRVLLGQLQKMASGEVIVSRWRDQFPTMPVYTMTMQTDGNLVFRCGSFVQWQSNTHVAGSYLTMQTDGNLVMRSPKGSAVWATNTQKAGPYTWFDVIGPVLYRRPITGSLSTVWAAKITYHRGCSSP